MTILKVLAFQGLSLEKWTELLTESTCDELSITVCHLGGICQWAPGAWWRCTAWKWELRRALRLSRSPEWDVPAPTWLLSPASSTEASGRPSQRPTVISWQERNKVPPTYHGSHKLSVTSFRWMQSSNRDPDIKNRLWTQQGGLGVGGRKGWDLRE